jgi:hypothetical protein
MAEKTRDTAVGAGTTAGDALDEEIETTSRAAEAVEDAQLESIRTTGAAPTGVPRDPGSDVGRGAGSPAPPLTTARTGGERPAQHTYPEKPRDELKQNEAGIGSRLEEKPSAKPPAA